MSYHATVRAFRIALIEHALACAGGNKTRASRILGIDRGYLCRLLRNHADHPDMVEKRGGVGEPKRWVHPQSGYAVDQAGNRVGMSTPGGSVAQLANITRRTAAEVHGNTGKQNP